MKYYKILRRAKMQEETSTKCYKVLPSTTQYYIVRLNANNYNHLLFQTRKCYKTLQSDSKMEDKRQTLT